MSNNTIILLRLHFCKWTPSVQLPRGIENHYEVLQTFSSQNFVAIQLVFYMYWEGDVSIHFSNPHNQKSTHAISICLQWNGVQTVNYSKTAIKTLKTLFHSWKIGLQRLACPNHFAKFFTYTLSIFTAINVTAVHNILQFFFLSYMGCIAMQHVYEKRSNTIAF